MEDQNAILEDNVIISPDNISDSDSIPFESCNINSNRDVSDFIPKSTLKRLPGIPNTPYADYYTDICWGNGFEKWSLVRFSTPMDGNCLFHAIANSFFSLYRDRSLTSQKRNEMIVNLRKELSEKLAEPIDNSPNAPRHYDLLNGGNTSAFSEAVPEFALDYMQKQLNSTRPIGYGYMEFIGNIVKKDIYILEALRQDIYLTDELPLTIKGNRNAVVLYYMNGHYELVGIKRPDEVIDGVATPTGFDTHFGLPSEHTFIKFLYNRVTSIIT